MERDPLKDVPLRDEYKSRFDLFERYPDAAWIAGIIAALFLLTLIAVVA